MVTRNVVITPQQAEMIETLVSNGRYQNASEVLRAGLRLVEREEAELEELRQRLVTSIGQANRGEFAEGTLSDVLDRAFTASVKKAS
jgi:antitoxin ParD1/3/4